MSERLLNLGVKLFDRDVKCPVVVRELAGELHDGVSATFRRDFREVSFKTLDSRTRLDRDLDQKLVAIRATERVVIERHNRSGCENIEQRMDRCWNRNRQRLERGGRDESKMVDKLGVGGRFPKLLHTLAGSIQLVPGFPNENRRSVQGLEAVSRHRESLRLLAPSRAVG